MKTERKRESNRHFPKDENNSNVDNAISKVEIEIKRHQQLFEVLSNPKRMWRVLLSLFFIIIILFWGIALVVIAIKKYYPYNIIETNLQGATTMNTEDKEVIYWLFNTADLWANSGIDVEKGDELTIRTSGASFTAIHHLVKASEENYKPDDEWVGTGGQRKDNPRDKLRAEYRINKNYDEGILLMQIIPSDSVKESISSKHNSQYFRNGPIEVIGKERRNLRISENGVLHFAVNDIVLTDDVIESMYKKWITSLVDKKYIAQSEDSVIFEMMKDDNLDGLMRKNNSIFNNSNIINDVGKVGLQLGRYPQNEDTSYYKAYPLINELNYYKKKHFYNAWYVDNLGSFLVVIERKKQ